MTGDKHIKTWLWLYPGAKKSWLFLLAGLLWLGVGFLLCRFAAGWLIAYKTGNPYFYLIPGLLAALIIHHFGFLKIVSLNLKRIDALPAKSCLFAFMSWKSYLLIAVMMTMGIALRHSAIPRQLLSVLYIAIGLALILSSLRYMRRYLVGLCKN